MAKRGAPNGNKNAKKSDSNRKEGMSISLYLDGYAYDFLGKSLEYEGKERNKQNIAMKARKLAKDAINLEARKTFARMQRDFDKEHAESGLPLEEFLDKWIRRPENRSE